MTGSVLRPAMAKPYKLLTILLILSSSSHANNYVINTTKTNVRFSLDGFNTANTMGGFYNIDGALQYSPSLRTGNISLTIPIKTLNTGNKVVNAKLTSKDFFDSQQFPLAHFQSTKWHFNNHQTTPKVIQVDGNLTLHGNTHPISLKASTFNCYESTVQEDNICSGIFTTTIDRTQWAINKFTLFGNTKNLTLNIQVAATRQ